ncbi:MAG: hypothetical protein QXI16_06600 [Sulfolobaceae archaeon]
MFEVVSIILDFWRGLFDALNGHLLNIGVDLEQLELTFYTGSISLYNYLILLATLLTVLFVVYLTYRFFVFLYRLVVRLWY